MTDVPEKSFVHWWSTEFIPARAVACFDMDHTLIKPLSGRVHPRDENDWELMNPSKLKSKLKALMDEGKCVVLISNQGRLDQPGRVKALETKLQNVQQALGVPLAFYAGYGKVHRYRKPAPGLWEQLTHDFMMKGVVVDKSSSFFCGDGAGRPAGPHPWKGNTKSVEKRDFADTDLRFAVNAGLTFYTPEQLFLGSDALALDPQSCDGLDPSTVPRCAGSPYDAIRAANDQEMVLLVGSPGSGKSSLAKTVFESKGYVWINMDTLKSSEKCATKTNEGACPCRPLPAQEWLPHGARPVHRRAWV